MKILSLIAGAAMLLGAQSAYAVTLVNGGFDAPPAASDPFNFIPAGGAGLTGWTVGGNGVDHIGNAWQPQNGANSLDLSGNGGTGHGSISQQLSGLNIGDTITISFYMSGNIGSGQDTKSLDLGLYNDAGLTSFVDGAGYIYNTALKNNSNADMKWALQTFTFVASQTSYYLAFFDTSSNPSNSGAALDNISIAATPIPPAILLFASALGGMGFLGYRRRKQAAAA